MSKQSPEYKRRNYHRNRILKLDEEQQKIQFLIKTGQATPQMLTRLNRIPRMIRQSYAAYHHGERIKGAQEESLHQIAANAEHGLDISAILNSIDIGKIQTEEQPKPPPFSLKEITNKEPE